MRLLTLYGPGGSGKTRLALELAQQVREVVADGVYVVDLTPVRDPTLVLSTVARAPGLQESRDQSSAEMLATFLRERAVLLVLDNCEQVLAAAPELALLLTAARVRHLPPAVLLERLAHPLELLVGGARDLPARQQTLCATIAWSYGAAQRVRAGPVAPVGRVCGRLGSGRSGSRECYGRGYAGSAERADRKEPGAPGSGRTGPAALCDAGNNPRVCAGRVARRRRG